MLTGDLNVAVVEWIVQYRIKDPRKYLFHVRDVPETFRYMSEAAMRQVVGDHSVDEVLTIGREEIAHQAKEELQRLCDLYGIGIEVQQLVLQDVNPPDPVKPAFNEVNQAIQEKERAINDAWADYNKAVPKAKGEAEQAVRAAEGLRARAREQRRGRRQALRGPLRGVPEGAGGHAQADLPRDHAGPDAEAGPEADRGRQGQGDPAARSSSAGPRRRCSREAPRSSWSVAIVVAVLLFASVYTVSETEQAILVQFGKPVGGLVTDARPPLEGALRPDGLPLRQALARVRRRPRPRSRPGTRSTSGSTPTPAGGSPIRSASFRRCATSAAPRAVSTTSSTARPATPWPPST